MPEKPSCPFCESPRLTLVQETELLRYYCCAYCFKKWGEARVAAGVEGERDRSRLARRAAPAARPDDGGVAV